MNCCTVECAVDNGCVVGGIECEGCGRMFCASDIGSDGLCYSCNRRAEEDRDAEEAEENESGVDND